MLHPFSARTAFLGACLLALLFAGSARSTELKSRFARFDNIRVHYQISGTGPEALIFVHGWACNAEFWRAQTGSFPSLPVIAVDLPGHGQSDKPHVDYTIDYFARSIAAVMHYAGVKRAVLVGHSMGAPIIGQFYRLYPEKTLGLMIVDGAMRLFLPKAEMQRLVVQLRENYKTAAAQLIDGMLTPVANPSLKSEIRTAMLSTPDYVATSAMNGLANEKIYGQGPIKVPVVAVLAKSHGWPLDNEQFLRSLAPKLELHIWDHVSHFLMMERPQEFNQTLQAFLFQNRLLGR